MSSSPHSHLLALETGGNQAFVYRGPRLRESIGASALIAAVGTTWVAEAIKSLQSLGVGNVEPVVTTSGKSILLGDHQSLREVLRFVSLRALADAPGLDVAGGIVEVGEDGFFLALTAAFAKLAENRTGLRGAEYRLQRLPLVDSCNSSGGPAAGVVKVRDRSLVLGHEALAKRSAADGGWRSMTSDEESVTFRRSINDLDQSLSGSWVAVVHADGSGMGQTFLSFDEHLRANNLEHLLETVEASADAYSKLSKAVEACTRKAWFSAAAKVATQLGNAQQLDLVPVLLGGDDITVIAAGNVALPFAEAYLSEFSRITGDDDDLRELGVGAISAGAAVVWTKPSFPYHAAYALAEERLKHAKSVAKAVTGEGGSPPPVLDVFVLYDSLIENLERSTPDESSTLLSANPYALATHPSMPSIETLKLTVKELRSDGVSSSQVHEIRTLLTTLGVNAAVRRFEELKLDRSTLSPLVHELRGQRMVLLLDALDLGDAMGPADLSDADTEGNAS